MFLHGILFKYRNFFNFICIAWTCLSSQITTAKLLQDGKEYLYETEIYVGVGTTDYAPHMCGTAFRMKTTVQVDGQRLNVRMSNLTYSQYVGAGLANHLPFQGTVYTEIEIKGPTMFSILIKENGLIESVTIPSDTSIDIKNIMKALASMFQFNNEHEKLAFVSTENTNHGKCKIKYVVTPNVVYKSVSHLQDCENHVHRIIDDWRGHTCSIKGEVYGGTDKIYSNTETALHMGQKNGIKVVNAFVVTGAVTAQMYDLEGVSHYTRSNLTATLSGVRSSPGDIFVSGETETDLSYKWSNNEYGWNKKRNLKEREPLFGSGELLRADQAEVKSEILKAIGMHMEVLRMYKSDSDSSVNEDVQKAHKYGITSIMPLMYSANYDTLISITLELLVDKSECGITKSNVFNELLASTGTTAAALVIKELIFQQKFDTERDATRVLLGVPFHIRRPNKQLLEIYEELLRLNNGSYLKMAIPLTFGHLIKITCRRAASHWGTENMKCVKDIAVKYVNKFWKQFQESNSKEEKLLLLEVIRNIGYGGIRSKLMPIVADKNEDIQMRMAALSALINELYWDKQTFTQLMPIFADASDNHEIRIYAFGAFMQIHHHSATDIATIMRILIVEQDYEVFNFVYTYFESMSNSIDPCDEVTKNLARYFIRYLRQFSENGFPSYKFGVSKIYSRQFDKKKYAYGGGHTYFVVGSHKSTLPLSLGLNVYTTISKSYKVNLVSVYVRIEGLAEELLEKFKSTRDPLTWKTQDLKDILFAQMNIQKRSKHPTNVQIDVLFKGSVIFHKYFGSSYFYQAEKITNFIETLKNLKNDWVINHQREIQWGSFIYEQPTAVGIPMAYINILTGIIDIRAKVKHGSNRGLLYLDNDYKMNMVGQNTNQMTVRQPLTGVSYSVFHDRVYKAHSQKSVALGLELIKRQIKLKVSRSPVKSPDMFLMHSQTVVRAVGDNVNGEINDFAKHCPNCLMRVILSKGNDYVKERVVVDLENQIVGSHLMAKYFDCEEDISKRNVIGHGIRAFKPYNKYPRNLWTMFLIGVRQINAFFLHFPKAEKCGARLTWSQSEVNPVKSVEIVISGGSTPKDQSMFFTGAENKLIIMVRAVGSPANREYKLILQYKYSPNRIMNVINFTFKRRKIEGFIPPYIVCMRYQNEYPDFTTEVLGYDRDRNMELKGSAKIFYGEGTDCDVTDGNITISFVHSTTSEARNQLEHKWYTKKCMEHKALDSWKYLNHTFPITDACYQMVQDATTAKKYTWNVQFNKLTSRMEQIVTKTQSLLTASFLSLWKIDSTRMEQPDEHTLNTSLFFKTELEFTDNEKNINTLIDTNHGKPIKLSMYSQQLDWFKTLRNLKFSGYKRRLKAMRLHKKCLVTANQITTVSNTTYDYSPQSCWTLMSGDCRSEATYAVFSRKSAGLPLAAKVYFGGHSVEFIPTSSKIIKVYVNGNPVIVEENKAVKHIANNVEIFIVNKWGSIYHVSSSLNGCTMYDGHFIKVILPPLLMRDNCGMCGSYNNLKKSMWIGKDGSLVESVEKMSQDWKWKC